MRIVVCTAWLGSADTLVSPCVRNPHVQHICMTDGTPVPAGWLPHHVAKTDRPRWLARWAKTNLVWLPPHDVSIWMDASFELLVDPATIVRAAAGTMAPIVGFVHPDRRRITEEAEAIIRCGQAPVAAVRHQIATYVGAGFDAAGNPQRVLTSTGLLVRWNSPDVQGFNAAWWHELETHTLRDQLSIDYCAWRRRVPIGHLPGHYRHNAFVRYDHTAHRRGRVA